MANWMLILTPNSSDKNLAVSWTKNGLKVTKIHPARLKIGADFSIQMPFESVFNAESTAKITIESTSPKVPAPFKLPSEDTFPRRKEDFLWSPIPNQVSSTDRHTFKFKVTAAVLGTGAGTYTVDPEMVVGPGNGFSLPST